MTERVEFVYLDRLEITRERSDAFFFRPDRPLPWLQRGCLWVLRKLKAFDLKKQIEYQRKVSFKPGLVVDEVIRQRGDLVRMCERGPTRLIIGAEDWARFQAIEAPTLHFAHEARFRYSDGSGVPKLGELTVEVVPWMRGLIVLPDAPPPMTFPLHGRDG